MKKADANKVVRVELNTKEINYLSAVVEAQANKIMILGDKQRGAAPIKKESRIINGLGKKLSPSSNG